MIVIDVVFGVFGFGCIGFVGCNGVGKFMLLWLMVGEFVFMFGFVIVLGEVVYLL